MWSHEVITVKGGDLMVKKGRKTKQEVVKSVIPDLSKEQKKDLQKYINCHNKNMKGCSRYCEGCEYELDGKTFLRMQSLAHIMGIKLD